MKTNNTNYDIFISYRRDGGAQYARILQLMLAQRGYRVFLDYDELTDGIFGEHIKAAIEEAPIFLLVLSKGSLARCVNEDDWVRQEILLALKLNKHIIPVNPDNSFDGIPEGLPEELCTVAGSHQHSEILFGQTLGITVDFLIEKRIVPKIGERCSANHIDTDFDAAKETLRKMDAHNRFMKSLGIFGAIVAIAIVSVACVLFWFNRKERDNLTDMRTDIENKYSRYDLKLSTTLSKGQIEAIGQILEEMSEIKEDTLWMGRFEFTEGLWHGVLGEECDESIRNLPKTDVSFGDIEMFLDTLRILAGTEYAKVDFCLPSAEEWEYAANGGKYDQRTTYAGSNDINAVAWYAGNSGGKVHASDGQQDKTCNKLNLFDMSGNVGEWCNSPYDIGTEGAKWTVCGGNYDSPADDVTVTSRKGIDINAKEPSIGFRLAIRIKDF